MKYLDFCGENISQLGIGTSSFPSTEETSEILNIAHSNGINYIDTAQGYHFGNMESYIGGWIPYVNRRKLFIATKRSIYNDISDPKQIIEGVKDQCKALNTSYIDFFMVHDLEGNISDIYDRKWKPILQNGYYQEALDELKRSGLVHHIGFSYTGYTKIFNQVLDIYDWEFCMVRNNFLDNYFQKKYSGETITPYESAMNYKSSHHSFGIMGMEAFQKSELIGLSYGENIPSEFVALKYNFKDNNPCLIGASDSAQLYDFMRRYNYFENNNPIESEDQLNYLIDKIIKYYESNVEFENRCIYCYKCRPQCIHNYNICFIKKQYNEAILKHKYSRLRGYLLYNEVLCDECDRCTVECPFGDLKSFISRAKELVDLDKGN